MSGIIDLFGALSSLTPSGSLIQESLNTKLVDIVFVLKFC
jgi:hypothetical protein